ncbi:hypothetical protein IAT38_004445 [Cryptococcus sp. DSM 104549]
MIKTGTIQVCSHAVSASQPSLTHLAPTSDADIFNIAHDTEVAISFVSSSGDLLPPSFHADAPIPAHIKLTVPGHRVPEIRTLLLGINLCRRVGVPYHSVEWTELVKVTLPLEGAWKVNGEAQEGSLECSAELVIPREKLRNCQPSWVGTGKAKGYSVSYIVYVELLDESGTSTVEKREWESRVYGDALVEILPFSLPRSGGGGGLDQLQESAVSCGIDDQWKVHGTLLQDVLSPTSIAPVFIRAFPPENVSKDVPVMMLSHLSLKRLVSSNIAAPGTLFNPSDVKRYLDATEIVSVSGWHDVSLTKPTDINVPFKLMPPGELGWVHGLSTHGTVWSEETVVDKPIEFAVKYFLELSVVFVPSDCRTNTPAKFAEYLKFLFPNCAIPPYNGFTQPYTPYSPSFSYTGSTLSTLCKRHCCHWVHFHLTMGSLAEAPGARNPMLRRYITHNSPDGRVREYEDWVARENDGWIVSPPDYEKAVESPPYVCEPQGEEGWELVETVVVADLEETREILERGCEKHVAFVVDAPRIAPEEAEYDEEVEEDG